MSPATVIFDPNIHVFFVPALSDMTRKELASYFWNDADIERSQEETVRVIRAMRSNEATDENGLCSRGLEHLTSQAHLEQRSVNKDMVLNSIFQEQWRQRVEGATKIDDQSLREASERASEWARNSARERGSKWASDSVLARFRLPGAAEAEARGRDEDQGSIAPWGQRESL